MNTKEKIRIGKSDVIMLLIAIMLIVGATCFYKPIIVSGDSMDYTLADHDILIAEKRAYDTNDPERGDIVVLKDPTDDAGRYIIKRVIGISGDNIVVKKNKVTVNGQQLDEQYLSVDLSSGGQDYKCTVGDNEVFVMGDNRPVSYDGRYFGPVSIKNIIGKTTYRVYPFAKFGSVYDENKINATFDCIEE